MRLPGPTPPVAAATALTVVAAPDTCVDMPALPVVAPAGGCEGNFMCSTAPMRYA